MYDKETVKQSIRDIGYKIHHFSEFHYIELDNLIAEVHEFIANSSLTYAEAWGVIAEISPSQEKFNESMMRVRETIYERDRC